MERTEILEQAVLAVDSICGKILRNEEYLSQMPVCVAAINQAVMLLLNEENGAEYILGILEDIMYGMTQQDEVFLLDVLRFGIKPEFERFL